MTLDLAVDAQPLIGRRLTGIGNYSVQLVRAMSDLDTDNRYHLPYFWSPRRRLPHVRPLGPNFRYRRVPLPMPAVQLLDRRGVDLAWDRFYRRLAACLFTGSVARPLRHGGNVRVIYDLVYLTHPETMPSPAVADEWRTNVLSTLPAIERIVAISEATKADVVERLGVDATRVVVAPPGIDATIFMPASSATCAEVRDRYGLERPYVLHTGMHEPRKNIPRLIRAFSRIPGATRGEVTLALTGPSSWGAGEIAAAVDVARNVGADVRLLDFVPRSDLVAIMSAASVFAFPSLQEGFGMPVLEAMACGAPIVTSDVPALREVAADAGRYVDPLDEDSLTDAIGAVLSDERTRHAMAERGRRRAANYSWADSARVVHDALLGVAR